MGLDVFTRAHLRTADMMELAQGYVHAQKMGYRGSFKDGEYHGEGVLITRDLSFQFPGITVWIGNFERNDLHGRGMILSYTPKRVIFDGVFNMGKGGMGHAFKINTKQK